MEGKFEKNESEIGLLDSLFHEAFNDVLEKNGCTAVYVEAGGVHYSFIPKTIEGEKLGEIKASDVDKIVKELKGSLSDSRYDWSNAISQEPENRGIRIEVDYSLVEKK